MLVEALDGGQRKEQHLNCQGNLSSIQVPAGGYLSRASGRNGSGNLGSLANHNSDRGLPPLPSANLLGEARDTTNYLQADQSARRMSIDQPEPGKYQRNRAYFWKDDHYWRGFACLLCKLYCRSP